MDRLPMVSIIIPVYNGANYLKEAIDSALAQTYPNIEILVVNDGSTDDGATERLALSYGDKIRYFSKENGGSSSALNTGIRNMRGDYFSWLSHDDLYEPNRTEVLVNMLKGLSTKHVAICGGGLIDAQGNKIFYANRSLNGVYTNTQLLKMFRKNYKINGCGILIAKPMIDQTGLFNENFRYVNDKDYWHRLILNGCIFVCTNQMLVKTRIHNRQVSVTSVDLYKTENEIFAKDYVNTLVSNLAQYRPLFDVYADIAARENNSHIILQALRQAPVGRWYRMKKYVKLLYYFLYGRILSGLKKAYKAIFFKR